MKSKKQSASAGFKEWASLFSGKLFVQIQVYCDESDTHAPKKGQRPPIPTVYGWIAEPDDWAKFHDEWQSVLNKPEYKAPYFHFCELHPLERKKKNETYSGWSDDKVEDFKIDLAIVAGRVAVPCGNSGNLEEKPVNYESVYEGFFKNCFEQIDLHWPKFKDRVDFFFERSGKDWESLINKVANKFPDNRLGAVTSCPWNDPRACIPLQAADLLVCSQRQSASWFFSHGCPQDARIIDYAMRRNTYPKGHRWRQDTFSDEKRETLIRAFRLDEKAIDGFNIVYGLPKKEYYPLEYIREQKKQGAYLAMVGGHLVTIKQR